MMDEMDGQTDRRTMKKKGLPQRVHNLKWPTTWKVSEIYSARVTYFHTQPMSLPLMYEKACLMGSLSLL